ncbi:unnamed protein product [Closterium sp. NIES-54]
MAVLGGHLLRSLGRRSADSASQLPPHAALLPIYFRPPFRRPPALKIVTSSESVELDLVTPALIGTETSDESGGFRSCEPARMAKKISSASPGESSSVSAVSAGQHGRRGAPEEMETVENHSYATPSPANERPPPSLHRLRDGTSGGAALGAFVGGSLREVERTMGAALVSGGDKHYPASANARPRSGGGGMRILNQGSSSSANHVVRRNSTGAHAAGFDGGRLMVRANSDSTERPPQSPGVAERSASSPWESHSLHTAAEAATVTGGLFSYYHGDNSITTSSGDSSSSSSSIISTGGWSVGSIWHLLHAPVSPIFRHKRHSANPWDHPTTATSSHGTNPWGHHPSPRTSRTNSTASCDTASNGVHCGSKVGSNGAGSTANKPPRHHRWASMDWSRWAGPHILPAARCPSASSCHIRSPYRNPATALTPMHVPACPGVPSPSLEAPPLLRRSRTEGTCETTIDRPVAHDGSASHHGGSMRDRVVSHEAWAMSVTSRAAPHEGCQAVPDTVGSLARARGRAPRFVPAMEHRLFCGPDNDPQCFRCSAVSFPRLQHSSAHQELVTELPAQPEAAQKLPLQKLPAQDLQAQQLSTRNLLKEHLPPEKTAAAAAEMGMAGGSRMHAPGASACDLHSHSPHVEGTGIQEQKRDRVIREPPLELKAEQHDWQPPSPTPVLQQAHHRRIRRMSSEPESWLDHRSEAHEGRERRRENEMGEGAVEASDIMVRSQDSGWCKVGGLHSWSPEHRKGGVHSGGSRMFVVNGGGSSHRQRGGLSMAVGMTEKPVDARLMEINGSLQLCPAFDVVESMNEAVRHPVACDDITSSRIDSSFSKRSGSAGRQVELMNPNFARKEGRDWDVQSLQPTSSSLFLESAVCQNWRSALNHPLFSGGVICAEDYMFSP